MSSQIPIRRQDEQQQLPRSIFEDEFNIIGDDEANEAREAESTETGITQRITDAAQIVRSEKHFFRTVNSEIREAIKMLINQDFNEFEIAKALKSGGYKYEDIMQVIAKNFNFMLEDERSYFRILVGLELGVEEVADKMAKFMRENSNNSEEKDKLDIIDRLISMLKYSGYFKEVKLQDIVQPLIDNFCMFNNKIESCYLVIQALRDNGYNAKELKEVIFILKNKDGIPLNLKYDVVNDVSGCRNMYKNEKGNISHYLIDYKAYGKVFKNVPTFGFNYEALEDCFKGNDVKNLDWLPFERGI